MTAKLHYIYDPLCGWCYGAEPLVQAATNAQGIELILHGGGLWPEPTRLPEDTRLYIREADGRVASMSGQPLGEAYLKGLILDPDLVLESKSTISAILAAKSLNPSNEFKMLKAIQHGHYENGLHVIRPEVLLDLAAECGIDRAEFSTALRGVNCEQHIDDSRQLMARIGAQGFPAFALETASGLHGVPHQQFSASPKGFADWLSEQVKII